MKIVTRFPVLALAALVTGCTAASATGDPSGEPDLARQHALGSHGDRDFHWRGTVTRGGAIEILGVNGAIRALESDDGTVRVDASSSARRSDPTGVRMEVVEHSGGVTICAVYPTPEGTRRRNECRPGGGAMDVRNNDVRVDFVVYVPEGIQLVANTVNGNISAEGLASDVTASAVNGNVTVRTTGAARARTVNGNVTARFGTTRLPDHLRFETVNGNVLLEMPDGLQARLHASTVHGRVDSDFPVEVSGRIDRHSVRGTIGGGGSELRLSTVNGSIRLRRI